MRFRNAASSIFFFAIFLSNTSAFAQAAPHLEQRGVTKQLIVNGQPFLMLAGELHNSSSSNLNYAKPLWPRLAGMGLNTVLTPISWELVEPTEGKYDFALVDGLIAQAREQHMHIVFLWLASWKNGMSGYAPVWVKQDTARFPRVVENGNEVNILTPLSHATRDADAAAFAAVMQHLRRVDGDRHTVLMMQVENEVGVLGDTRDHSTAANHAFAAAVPAELLQFLQAHKASLDPEFLALWQKNGEKMSGTWGQVFGDTSRADEIFMAWYYGQYVNAVAAKGKAAYNLPMYVNTWLAGQHATPGTYPSGGAQPRVLDIWKAAGTSLDFYSPDLYAADFPGWCKRYHRAGNPLFIPETRGGAAGAANVFYAVGQQAALGFSPFGIDPVSVPQMTQNQGGLPTNGQSQAEPTLKRSYDALAQIWPLLQKAQAQGTVRGFLLDKSQPSIEFNLNGYVAHVRLDEIFGTHADKGFGLIMATGPHQFTGVGMGFRAYFTRRWPSQNHVGIASIDEGKFQNGQWMAGRRLNGDESDQGSAWRFDSQRVKIEKAELYSFK